MQILTLTGNVGRDPESKTTQKGDTVTSFSVASKQGFSRDAKTEWFRCSVWGKRGETVAERVRKGMAVTVVGEFTIGEYQGKPQYDLRVIDLQWPFTEVSAPRQEPQTKGGFRDDLAEDFDSVPF